MRGSSSTTLANSGTTTAADSKRKRGALPTRYSSGAARLRCHADFKYSGTHDNTQARITESPRRCDDSDDHIHGFSVGFSDRWWEPMTRRIRETDPPSPQSAADSKTGSSSSSAAAARSSNGRVGGALVSQPRLLQIPLSAHNSPILFCLSPPAAAFARASPSAHLTSSSERAAERHGPLVLPELYLAPLHTQFAFPGGRALPTCAGWAGRPKSLPRLRRPCRQHHALRYRTTDTGLRARAAG